ncbi:MAG: peptide-methionine (S)-S-oxide reductase MsrA [Pseudomonadota bacterium]|nr:peptide-methionine (S)-S-oxide reductase MsrA [Pseudomonadota bacterium]
MQSIYLAGGCFWCVEAIYINLRGVQNITPGYIGGFSKNPTYEEICKGTTGHAEAIKCDFDDKVITLELILEIFFVTHDPTQKNRQGNDIGTQYRSAIFYTNLEQQKKAEEAIKKAEKIYQSPIQTELSDKLNFFVAEKYHHNYFFKNPNSIYCNALIPPKLKKLEEKYSNIFKN